MLARLMVIMSQYLHITNHVAHLRLIGQRYLKQTVMYNIQQGKGIEC